jgi:hypothetical protein
MLGDADPEVTTRMVEYKRIAMRADKTDGSFAAMIYIAAAVIHSR